MAPLPYYPDVGRSPPQLYRRSAGSAGVMRTLLITTAQTLLTLTAPSEEHICCARAAPRPRPSLYPFPSLSSVSSRPVSGTPLQPSLGICSSSLSPLASSVLFHVNSQECDPQRLEIGSTRRGTAELQETHKLKIRGHSRGSQGQIGKEAAALGRELERLEGQTALADEGARAGQSKGRCSLRQGSCI